MVDQLDADKSTHAHRPSAAVNVARLISTGRLVGETHKEGGLSTCAIKHGDSGLRDDFGGSFSTTLSDSIGTGYNCVNVQLSGWYLDFLSKDHHIDTISVRFKDIHYDASSGGVSWTVVGNYQDKNYDDDYRWRVWWTILALK